MNSSEVGILSVMEFVTKCLEKEWKISLPVGKERYDCILDRGDGFERIQVKTGRLKAGSIVFKTSNSPYHSKDGPFPRKGYQGEVEQFGIYCPETHRCYMVPINDVPSHGAYLRIDKLKHYRTEGIRWAKDYEI